MNNAGHGAETYLSRVGSLPSSSAKKGICFITATFHHGNDDVPVFAAVKTKMQFKDLKLVLKHLSKEHFASALDIFYLNSETLTWPFTILNNRLLQRGSHGGNEQD